jgi:TRAP-type C4-dicarboxylate transport system permease small subunit
MASTIISLTQGGRVAVDGADDNPAGGFMNDSLVKEEKAGKRWTAEEVIRVTAKTSYYTGTAFLLIIMLLINIDVIGRFFFNSPLWGVLEISEFMLAGCVLLGLGYTEFLGGNVMVELFYDRYSPLLKNIMRLFFSILGIGLYGVIAYTSGILTIDLFKANLTSDVLKIPAWPFRAFVPIGASLVVLVLLVKLFKDIKELRERRKPQ